MISVEVDQHKEHAIEGGTLIVSVPGPGTGNILLTDFLLDRLGMDSLASLRSPASPPVAMIHDGKPRHPARIHADLETRVAVLRSEFPAAPQLARPMALAVLDWAERQGVQRIMTLDAVPARALGERGERDGDMPPVVFVASNAELRKAAKGEGLKEFGNGALGGVAAILLLEGRGRGIGVLSLLAGLGDPMDDADSVMAFARVLPKFVEALDIDMDALGKEIEKIQQAVKAVQDQAHRAMSQLEDREAEADSKQAPPMYR